MQTQIFLILLIAFAIMAVQTDSLGRAVIYLCTFSLISSYCYLLYSAPDVAIAEAIIGSTIATILYLIALKRHNVLSICYSKSLIEKNSKNSNQDNIYIVDMIENFCKEHELELVIEAIDENEPVSENDLRYDMIISEERDKLCITGNMHNYHVEALDEYILDNSGEDVEYEISDEEY